ncbi:RNA-binding protein, putative [Plasmodium chabaudi chabaudi]|uniref:RNA-binding protein, putative n=1 Tax=Plasmodium chabaudi chabaudi TaxID=31271 RepID=A0A1C6X7W6_PLACU|nr:RNA-binding protein, putative [Plasmodium chabaudi chabaudi]
MDNISENNDLFITDENTHVQNMVSTNTNYNKNGDKIKLFKGTNKLSSTSSSTTNASKYSEHLLNNIIKNMNTKNGKNKFIFSPDLKNYDQIAKEDNVDLENNNINNIQNVPNCEETQTNRNYEKKKKKKKNLHINGSKNEHYIYNNNGNSNNSTITNEGNTISNTKTSNCADAIKKGYNLLDENNFHHIIDYKINDDEIKLNDINNQFTKEINKDAKSVDKNKEVKESQIAISNDIKKNKSNCNLKNVVITNVFLGNIPPNITEERLKNVLEIFGYIIHIEYKWSLDKWSYAFIYFIEEKCAINAVNILNQKKFFDNSPNHKLICFIVSKQIPNQNTLHYSKANFSLLKDGPPGANLFLYGIPLKWTELNLIQLVNKYGHVVGLRIPYINNDNDKKQGNRGFGFVSYDNKKSAVEAFEELSKMYIHGKLLKVQLKNGEEHLLPAKLKNICNNNKNKTKDSSNTKTAQSLVSTTDTLKTINSINSTDEKNKPKTKSSSSNNTKSINFITNKNKENKTDVHTFSSISTVCDNVSSNTFNPDINKHMIHPTKYDNTCPIEMYGSSIKNNDDKTVDNNVNSNDTAPCNNSNYIDASTNYMNTNNLKNISDKYPQMHRINENINNRISNNHPNNLITSPRLSNDLKREDIDLYNNLDDTFRSQENYNKNNSLLSFINMNNNTNLRAHMNSENDVIKNGNKFINIKDNNNNGNIKMKKNGVNKNELLSIYDNVENKFECVDNNDLAEKGKKYFLKKRRNFQLNDQKEKNIIKSFNYPNKIDMKYHKNLNNMICSCTTNFLENPNINRNEICKLNNLKNKGIYNPQKSHTIINSNESNINACNKFFINDVNNISSINEQIQLPKSKSYKNKNAEDNELFKPTNNKTIPSDEGKSVSSFLNQIWYNKNGENNIGNDNYNSDIENRIYEQKVSFHNADINYEPEYNMHSPYNIYNNLKYNYETIRDSCVINNNQANEISKKNDINRNVNNWEYIGKEYNNKNYPENGINNKNFNTKYESLYFQKPNIGNTQNNISDNNDSIYDDKTQCLQNFKHIHQFFTLINTYATENSLNVYDYINKENIQLYELICSKYDNQMDKKSLENIFIAFMLKNKENQKSCNIDTKYEKQPGRKVGIQTESVLEKREEDKQNENILSYLRKTSNDPNLENDDFFYNNYFNSNFFTYPYLFNDDNNSINNNNIPIGNVNNNNNIINVGNNTINCMGDNNINGNCQNNVGNTKETYFGHDDIFDNELNDIYTSNDYMDFHNYDTSFFSLDIKNPRNNDENKINDNTIPILQDDDINKFMLYYDDNNESLN